MPAKKISMDKLRGVVNMGREAEENMEEHLHISVLVDPLAEGWLVRAVRDAFVPERDAVVDVHALGGVPTVAGIDVGVVVAGGSDELVRNAIRAFAGVRQHVVVVAQSSLDVPETHLPSKLGQYVKDAVSTEREALVERMADVLLDATEKDVSCAANFAFCRDVATARLVSRCAARNAFMSVADFIPGAGMPLMTMNQINLSFDIAATYGHGLSLGRVPEVTAVVFAGFAYRWASRLVTRVFPHLGLLLRVGIAYGGTLVTGRMLASHFTDPFEDEYYEVPSSENPIREAMLPFFEKGEEVEVEAPSERVYISIGEGGALA